MSQATKQRGVALLTALLIVTLVTIIAGVMTQRLHLDLRRVQNQQTLEQGFQYSLGLEALARIALVEDARDSASLDHNGESWAQALPPLSVDGGLVTGRINDLDGRFNLNNLVIDDVVQAEQVTIFGNLLTLLNLDPGLTNAVVDWLDSDSLPAARGGAEDNAYARAVPAYRAANQRFHHPSELRLVSGFDQPTIDRLLPYITALPIDSDPSKVNVNTASMVVLQALDPAITEQVAEVLYQQGRAQFTKLELFVDHPLLFQRRDARLRSLVSLDSRYFLVHSTVQLEGRLQHFYSVIEQDGGWRVTWRSRSAY